VLSRALVILMLTARNGGRAGAPGARSARQRAGARIVLHYTTTGTDAITAADAARLAGIADAAIGVVEGTGFRPCPATTTEHRRLRALEEHFASGADAGGVARLDLPVSLGTGYVVPNPNAARVSSGGARDAVHSSIISASLRSRRWRAWGRAGCAKRLPTGQRRRSIVSRC
jgi:hypothetical protein